MVKIEDLDSATTQFTFENDRKFINDFYSTKPSQKENKYNVAYAFKPLHMFLVLFGMNKFVYDGHKITPVGSLSKLYSFLWFAAVIGSGSYLTIAMLNKVDQPQILLAIYALGNVGSVVTAATGIIRSTIFNSKKTTKMIKNIEEIDKNLGIISKKNYDTIRINIVIFLIIFVLINILHYVYEDYCELDTGIGKNLLATEHVINMLTILQLVDFTVVLFINTSRLKVLNEKLKNVLSELPKIYEDDDTSMENLRNDFKNVKVFSVEGNKSKGLDLDVLTKKRSDQILFVMKNFDAIADNIQIINSCYGLPLLFASTTTFMNILSTINGIIMFDQLHSTNGNFTIPLVLLWCLPIIIFLITATYAAEILKDEVDEASVVIDKLTINPAIDSDQLELLECFSQMITGRNVFISANNFFPFDFSFIFSLVGTVATYTVILMQVNDPSPLATAAANSSLSNLTDFVNNTIMYNVTVNTT